MSTSSQMSLKSPRKGNEVRSRLLNNLGVFKPPSGSTVNMTPTDPAIARKMNILRGMGLGGLIPPQPLQVSSQTVTIDTGDIVSKLSLSAMTIEPLKYKRETLLVQSVVPSSSSPTDTNNNYNTLQPQPIDKRPRKQIQFNDDVSVVPIPMRSEYSERVRARLWSDRFEIHDMASRNALEFAAEGWDWKNVIEDDGMFVCTASGELIHPVHCQR
jgi:hypothetical protein